MSTVLDLFNIVWAKILSSSKNELTLNTLISSAISKMLAFSKEFSTEAVTELVLKYNIRSPKVLDFLKEHETLVSAQDHYLVAKLFKASSDRNWNKVGVNLERLRIDRNKVDYDDSVSGLRSMSKLDLILAQQIITILNRL